MKKLLFTILCILSSVSLYAEDKKISCLETKIVFKSLREEYGEVPFWIGMDDKLNKFALFVNKKTGTWTLLEFDKEFACALGAGQINQLILTGPII